MILLRPQERRRRRDLGNERPAEAAAGLVLRFRRLGCDLLLGRVVEDGGAVLRAPIGGLAVERGWVVVGPEDVEELVVGDLGRVVLHFDDLGVAGAVSADVLI